MCDEDVDGSDRTRVPAPTNPLHPTPNPLHLPYLFSLTANSNLTPIHSITLTPINTNSSSITISLIDNPTPNPSRSPILTLISL